MNKWLDELKKLGAKKSILTYYKDLIIENDLKTYDQICSDIGTPQNVYIEEYGENTFKQIKENLGTKFLKSTRNILLSIFVIFPLSILIFTLFVVLIGLAGSFFAIWWFSAGILQKFTISFIVICLFITAITLIHILSRTFLKISRIISNIKQKISFNKKILLMGLITSIISAVCIIFLPNDYKLIQINQGQINTQTLNINSKNLNMALDDSDVEIIQDSKNSIEYNGYGKIFDNNGKIRVNDKKYNIRIGFSFLNNSVQKDKIKLHISKDTNINFSGIDSNINLNNVQVNKFKTNGIDTNISLNKFKAAELEIFGTDTKVNLNNSNIENVKLNSLDSEFSYKNSKIQNLDNEDKSTAVNKN